MRILQSRALTLLLLSALAFPAFPAAKDPAKSEAPATTKPTAAEQALTPNTATPPASTAPVTTTDASKPPIMLEGTIKTIADGAVTLTLPKPRGDQILTVDTQVAKDSMAQARIGDRIKVDVDSMSAPTAISKVESIDRPIEIRFRILALIGGFGILFAAACAATRAKPLKFMIGTDNRYSNSQTQLILWFGAVASVYFAATVLRVCYLGLDSLFGISIPEHLLELSGLSALSYGGAKVITSQKVDAAEQAGLMPVKVPAARANLLSDLFTNDKGNADLGDFQMILVTLSAVVLFLLSEFHSLAFLKLGEGFALQDIDSTMLAGFGLGHGAYLVKKAAVKAGDG